MVNYTTREVAVPVNPTDSPIAEPVNPVYNERWDDLRFPFTPDKQGANLKPDFDYTNLGLLFPKNDATEQSNMIVQLPHDLKLGSGSALRPHIHFIQSSSSKPVFKMTYRIYNNGDTVPEYSDPVSIDSDFEFDYVSGNLLQVASFPEIDISEIVTGLSAIIDIILYREDNVVNGDVLVKEFDIHYIKDELGSRTEHVK